MQAAKDIANNYIRPQTQSPFRTGRDAIDARDLAEQEEVLRRVATRKDPQGRCGACHGMKRLRAEVDIEHRLFGMYRLCVCHPRYEEFGNQWFR